MVCRDLLILFDCRDNLTCMLTSTYFTDFVLFTGKIKRVCETELGLISQCCLPKHVYACKPQYMENVALKINVKVCDF